MDICRICGAEFPSWGRQKCCSPECRAIYKNLSTLSNTFNTSVKRGVKWKRCQKCGHVFYDPKNVMKICHECAGKPEPLTVAECKLCKKCAYRDNHNMCGYAAENESMRGEPVSEHCSRFLPKGGKKPVTVSRATKKRGRPKKNKAQEVRAEKEEKMDKIVLEPKVEMVKSVIPDTAKEPPRDLEEPSRDDIVKALELLRSVCEHYKDQSCKACPFRHPFTPSCELTMDVPSYWPETTTEDTAWRAFN